MQNIVKKYNDMEMQFRFTNPEVFVKSLIRRKEDFYLRKTHQTTTVVYDHVKFLFKNPKSNFPPKYLFLFNKVKKDAVKWTAYNEPDIPKTPTVYYNPDYDSSKGILVGVDIDHAYWRIAFLKGIISDNTYIQGLPEECKVMRLATLAVLGQERKLLRYKKGELIEHKSEVIRERDPKLALIYLYVRHTCYAIMEQLAKLLGDDFYCWRTDAIYFRSTTENIKTITDNVNKRGLSYKILDYYDKD